MVIFFLFLFQQRRRKRSGKCASQNPHGREIFLKGFSWGQKVGPTKVILKLILFF